MQKTPKTRTASETDAGERIDRWISVQFDISRSRTKNLVKEGFVFLDGKAVTHNAAKIIAGGTYEVRMPEPVEATPNPEDIPLDVLFEDEDLIVVNKPTGMAVHPAVGNWTGTLVNALLHHCADSLSGIGGVIRPGIVHRIDKDTSGILVVAKNDQTHIGLSKQFADKSAARSYIAFTRTAPDPLEGRVESLIGRSSKNRKKMAVLDEGEDRGKRAVTNYRTLKTYGQIKGAPAGTPQAAKIECRLETGRTHQIRVHMAHAGAPLLGDPVYGRGKNVKTKDVGVRKELAEFRRQALHAASLGFEHPRTGEWMEFTADLPKDMQRLEKFLELL